MKKYLVGFVFIAVIAGMAFWWFNRQPTLTYLQKAYLIAKTDAEREKIIDRLEEYYVNLSIPDSSRNRVDDEVASMLEKTEIDLTKFRENKWDTVNVYMLENQLKDLLETAMIARAREEDQTFQELMIMAKKMAATVDEGTGVAYWARFIRGVSDFDKNKAVSWLKAKTASRLCYQYHDKSKYWQDGEKFGSLGLQLLKESNDIRLKLDLMQRIQWILFYFRGLNDLSIELAKHSSKKANQVNYILREIGISYHQAEAHNQNGQVKEALELFQEVKYKAEIYHEVPKISWYKKNALLNTAVSLWHLGQFENAWSMCNTLEKLYLSPIEKMRLHNMRGLVHRSLGYYEKAEREYKIALELADAENIIPNKIQFLNNLGAMYYQLTEHDKALDYYYRVKNLIEQNNLVNSAERITNLVTIARVMIRKNRYDSVGQLTNEASNLITKIGSLPWRRAELLLILGNFKTEIGKNQDALKNYLEAEAICDQNGLFQLGLPIKIETAKTMIKLNQMYKAQRRISEVIDRAERIDDLERIIDSIALLAEIERKKGNISKAVELSDSLIIKTEELSSRFKNKDRLTSYRQKIYDYLKHAVVDEIHYNRIDSAFAKLDYAKARSLKNLNKTGNGISGYKRQINLITLKNRLSEGSILVDYLVTNDTLFTFIFDHQKLRLLRKAIKKNEFEETVTSYKNAIRSSIEVFKNYDPVDIKTHFNKTTLLGQKLFKELFPLESFQNSFKRTDQIYIVPDEFLYDLPFATLVIDSANSTTYLTHKAALVTLPSSSFLHPGAKRSNHLNLIQNKILISADPSFPGVPDLMLTLKANFPGAEELQVNKEPSKQDILNKLTEGHNTYIIIGHGVANTNYPDQSFIQFTIKNSITSDSKSIPITVSDLRQISWPGAEMVMLIGCETGTGKLYRGTGIAGLQHSFISMGASQVLASLWKIQSAETISQVQNFIQLWISGSNPEFALKKTQLKSINKLKNHRYFNYSHPYLWGSFSLLRGYYNES